MFICRPFRRARCLLIVLAVMLGYAVPAAAVSGTATAAPKAIDDSQLRQYTTTIGGASVLSTTRTIAHRWGSTHDPLDGTTYGYNMVGADPRTCQGSGCSVTIQADITPLQVRIDGTTFSGSDVVAPLLASPLFALNDYGSTPYASAGTWDVEPRGPGGVLSQGDVGNRLQLEDATMRAQFNQTGASSYHLELSPNVMTPVTIDVPQNQGMVLKSGRGVVFAAVNMSWWIAQIQHLLTGADPAHLALYLTDDTLLYQQQGGSFLCCTPGYHGERSAGTDVGSGHSNGNAAVQTMAWASWLSPGVYARPDGGQYWATQDINVLSHEISEWADDPFASNNVQPWPYVPAEPQLGCARLLETGDPVAYAGFAIGTNTFQQGPNPNGTVSADGYYHPQDEAMLPWFTRQAPNTLSEPTQTPSANIGRYTLLGDLDTYPGMTQPAVPC